jgi:formylmethanofuran dehydrogenase subunit E
MQKWRLGEKRRVQTTRRLLQREGKSLAEIATELAVPLKTVRKYISTVKAEDNELLKCFSCGAERRRKETLGSVTGKPLCEPCWNREYRSQEINQEK